MKVFFDTNVYIAEALLGEAAATMLDATVAASWRIFVNEHVLEEIEHVVVDDLGFSARLARLTREKCRRRALFIDPPPSRHQVAADAADSPILNAAIASGADFLVTNDQHLLALNPYEGLRIMSMNDYYQRLVHEGLIPE